MALLWCPSWPLRNLQRILCSLMSLLQEAEKCIANQLRYGSLNALIPGSAVQLESCKSLVSAAQARRNAQRAKSPLDGRLFVVKDNICTNGYPTTCASGMLQSFESPIDATVVGKLRNAGAIIAGKANLDEFGMGSHSIHSYFGPVQYSHDIQKDGNIGMVSAGGSSGGSAVAVATDQCHGALGTDTGGSVRLPAAYTGIVGFKPSYGLISRWGVVAYANSLDTVGILSQTTKIAREIFNSIEGFDPQDPTSLSEQTRARITQETLDRKQLRIGVPTEYNIKELNPVIRDAWTQALVHLRKQGHEICPVSLPMTPHALSAYYVLAPAEASSNLAKFDGARYGTTAGESDQTTLFSNSRGQGLGEEVRRRILLGTYTLSAQAMDNYFIKAQRVRRLVQDDFDQIFRAPHPLRQSKHPENVGGVDVLVTPTAPAFSPSLESLPNSPPMEEYMNDVFTVPASLAGLPAVSVPVSTRNDQYPERPAAGIQVIGQYGDDDLVLTVGGAIEERG